jgi:hypothetical protein
MTCVGNTIYGHRCRLAIRNKEFSQICSLLDERIDEWEVAIQEATRFYESGKGLKEKNRKRKERLEGERSEIEELERKFDAEMSRRKQELKSISSMSMEVSSLRAKLSIRGRSKGQQGSRTETIKVLR